MSYFSYNRVGSLVSPEQIDDLQAVLREVCDECGYSQEDTRASECAAVLIRSAQRGISDKSMLIDIGRAVLRSPAIMS